MIVSREIPGGIHAILTNTRIDMTVSRDLRKKLSELILSKPPIVVIDLKDAVSIDSSGLGSLVSLYREIKAYGGQLRLVHANQDIASLIALSKLDAMLKICETLEEACSN